MIQSVIFDMDGVLIDSEPAYQKDLYRGLLPKYPWLKLEDFYPMAGMSDPDGRAFVAKLVRREASDPEVYEQIQEIYDTCKVNYRDIMRPEVPEVLRELKEMGIKIALASSSGTENIETVLKECGIREYFDTAVSGQEFEKSKPDPEIYIHTMRKLGSRAEECLIVEDSTFGIEAGDAAGVKVAAIRDERFPFDQSRAAFHMDSLREVPGLVRRDARGIKAAFFDVDGTLTDILDHRMPESTKEALERLRKRKIPVLLSTGRHVLEIEEENMLPDIALDGAVWMNGQLCELNGETVSENYIPADQLKLLREFLTEHECSCIFLERDDAYCNFVNELMIREQERIGTAVPKVRSIEDLETRKIYQAMPFITAEEEEELLTHIPECSITRWGDSVVDLIAKGGGKEQGILTICRALQISPEEIIAFGDGENDAGMLKLAGIGVAMGNALDFVKEAADYVTDDIHEDGIRNALEHFGII